MDWLTVFHNSKRSISDEVRFLFDTAKKLDSIGMNALANDLYESAFLINSSIEDIGDAISEYLSTEAQEINASAASTIKALLNRGDK